MLLVVLILQLSVHVFGFRTVFGHCELFLRESFLPKQWLTKIGILYFCAIFVFAYYFDASVAALTHFFAIAIYKPLSWTIYFMRINAILQAIPEWLSLCELQVRLGKSVQGAIESIKINEDGWRRSFLDVLVQSLQYSGREDLSNELFKNTTLKKFFDGLRTIHRARMNQWERLNLFEKQMLRDLDFRHRSSQILLQNRIQIVVVLILHVGLAAVSIRGVGWSPMSTSVVASTVLVFLGAVACYFIGRRLKWSY
jgi:hypothetical protein